MTCTSVQPSQEQESPSTGESGKDVLPLRYALLMYLLSIVIDQKIPSHHLFFFTLGCIGKCSPVGEMKTNVAEARSSLH